MKKTSSQMTKHWSTVNHGWTRCAAAACSSHTARETRHVHRTALQAIKHWKAQLYERGKARFLPTSPSQLGSMGVGVGLYFRLMVRAPGVARFPHPGTHTPPFLSATLRACSASWPSYPSLP